MYESDEMIIVKNGGVREYVILQFHWPTRGFNFIGADLSDLALES